MASWCGRTIFSERSRWNGKIHISAIFRAPHEQGLLGNLSAEVTSASDHCSAGQYGLHSTPPSLFCLIDPSDVFLDLYILDDVQTNLLQTQLQYDFTLFTTWTSSCCEWLVLSLPHEGVSTSVLSEDKKNIQKVTFKARAVLSVSLTVSAQATVKNPTCRSCILLIPQRWLFDTLKGRLTFKAWMSFPPHPMLFASDTLSNGPIFGYQEETTGDSIKQEIDRRTKGLQWGNTDVNGWLCAVYI